MDASESEMAAVLGGGELFHASGEQGVTLFVPRRFWHSADFTRSGRLRDGQEPPEGVEVLDAFYATERKYLPFYFPPPGVRRIQVWAGKHSDFDASLTALGMDTTNTRRVILIDEADRHRLTGHWCSVYVFDRSAFRRVSPSEWVALAPVAPLGETVLENALEALTVEGVHVEFVPDLAQCFRDLKSRGLAFDAQGDFRQSTA
jgi:hypothetical protein